MNAAATAAAVLLHVEEVEEEVSFWTATQTVPSLSPLYSYVSRFSCRRTDHSSINPGDHVAFVLDVLFRYITAEPPPPSRCDGGDRPIKPFFLF